MLPDLNLPIEDENAAGWWRDEFERLYNETEDAAYLDSYRIVLDYIELNFPNEEDWA